MKHSSAGGILGDHGHWPPETGPEQLWSHVISQELISGTINHVVQMTDADRMFSWLAN